MNKMLPIISLTALLAICNILIYVEAYKIVGRLPKDSQFFLNSVKDRVSTTDQSRQIEFAGIKLNHPLSTSLLSLGIVKPSPIQQAAIVPLSSGMSSLLHASTGTGKTMAYLLPALKRLLQIPAEERKALQIVVLTPTKELAMQVSSDVRALLGEEGQEEGQGGMVQTVIQNFPGAKMPNLSPILIGTASKVLNLFASLPDLSPLEGTQYLVLDEVDRLLSPPSRFVASLPQEPSVVEKITNLYKKVYAKGAEKGKERERSRGPKGKADTDKVVLTDQMQVIGASATVGRPLRREMFKLFSSSESSYGGQFEVIRPVEASSVSLRKYSTEEEKEGSVKLISIPPQIRHVSLLPSEEEESLTLALKLSLFKKIWNQEGDSEVVQKFPLFNRGLLFVPKLEDVDGVVNMLRYWKMGGQVENLLSLLLRDKGQKLGISSLSSTERILYVAPYSGTRGLHLPDLDCVFIPEPPKTMDEYLHLAGRTGRMSPLQQTKEGTVLTIADVESLRRMTSWETALEVTFDVLFM